MKIIGKLEIMETGGDLVKIGSISNGQILKRINNDLVGQTVLPGSLVQSRFKKETTLSTLSSQIPFTDSVPQITDGSEIISDSITPSLSTNKIRIKCSVPIASDYENTIAIALFKDSDSNAIAAVAQDIFISNNPHNIILEHEDSPNTESQTTYSLRIGSEEECTMTINGVNGVRRFGGAMGVTMTLEEITA